MEYFLNGFVLFVLFFFMYLSDQEGYAESTFKFMLMMFTFLAARVQGL